jgi:NAD(P)-dependent dehydrogenase (short-subunit alcohol dehydrogenase family)
MRRSSGLVLAAGAATATAAASAIAFAAVGFALTRRRRQVVVITGGSRGLGLSLAERFGRERAQLVLIARDSEELEKARAGLIERKVVRKGEDIFLVASDLTSQVEAEKAIGYALRRFGRINVLINNAGIIEVGPVENQPIEAYERAMATNFFGALYATHAALPSMLGRFKKAGERSAVVNISSIGGKFAMPHLLPYVASKFALTGFSEGLHAELRAKGVRVTTVCPGLMRTGSHVRAEFRGDTEKEYRWFSLGATTPIVAAGVERAADKIYRAVKSGRAEITITPQAWLAARLVGVAPETVQRVAGWVNEYVLPGAVEG